MGSFSLFDVQKQLRFIGNVVFGKKFLIPKKVCQRFSKRASDLVLLQKSFSPKFFVEYFSKNILNLGIKNVLLKLQTNFCFLLFNLCVGKVLGQDDKIYSTWLDRNISQKNYQASFSVQYSFL